MRTDFNCVHVDDTPSCPPWAGGSPFRQPRAKEPTLQGQQNPGQSDDGPVVNVPGPRNPQCSSTRACSISRRRKTVKTYVSRRSTTSSARVRSIKHHLDPGRAPGGEEDVPARDQPQWTQGDDDQDVHGRGLVGRHRVRAQLDQVQRGADLGQQLYEGHDQAGATGPSWPTASSLLRLNRWSADVTLDMERYN